MKTVAVVFDNAGTILRRVTAIKYVHSDEIFYETNTIGIANENDERVILVIQKPTPELIKDSSSSIYEFLLSNPDLFEISYSQKEYSKEDVLSKIAGDPTTISEIKKTAHELIDKYDIEICSGSALIINMSIGCIEYVFTAGGMFFSHTIDIMDYLHKNNYDIYIASGDNKPSLMKIADKLKIVHTNVYDTTNRQGKMGLILKLKEDYSKVIMVGNNTNDELALEASDISILTHEQKEELPKYLEEQVDYNIDSISEIKNIIINE